MTEAPRSTQGQHLQGMHLVGPPRHRVKYWAEAIGKGRPCYIIAMKKPAFGTSRIIGNFVAFSDQCNGNLHIISADLVESIEVQRTDAQYGEWHTVDTLQLSEVSI